MLKEKLLVNKFNKGSTDALRKIYELYKNDLFGLATTLLNDSSSAEDIVHDVFVRFAQKAGVFELKSSLRDYLLTSVANAVRDRYRAKSTQDVSLETVNDIGQDDADPSAEIIFSEESKKVNELLAKLKYSQREVVVLHLYENMKFRQIAQLQGVSMNTAQSRYRYGIDKLRSMLNGEIE